jgi:hypothetical protein
MEPIAYKLTNYAYFKLLVASQEVEVKNGFVERIGIEPIYLPPNTFCSILSVIRHGLGIVLDVYCPKGIGEEGKIKEVTFLPIEDGLIQSGDLLGVIKVFILGKEPELRKVENQLSRREVNLAYKIGEELRREKATVSEMWYRRWHLAEWLPLIANEDLRIEKGKPLLIDISPIEIPANTIPVPLFIMRNAYGIVLDLFLQGRQKRVEEDRTVSKALFMPVSSGEVMKGDVLGILNVYNISVGERSRSLLRYLTKIKRGFIVYKRDGHVLRKEFEFKPFQFKRSSMGRIEPIIAAERKEVGANRLEVVEIEEIDLPSCTIVQPTVGSDLGAILDVFSHELPKMVEEEKRINQAVLLPYKNANIVEGDLLGWINIYHITVLYMPEAFILRHGGIFTR